MSLLLSVVFICGCDSKNPVNFLNYQTYPFEAHGTLTFDKKSYKVSVTVKKQNDIRLEFLSPESISGIVLELDDGKASVKSENIDEMLDDGGYSQSLGVFLAAEMFSIPAESFHGVSIVSENGISYNKAEYRTKSGRVYLYIQNGLSFPDRISAELNGRCFEFLFMNE